MKKQFAQFDVFRKHLDQTHELFATGNTSCQAPALGILMGFRFEALSAQALWSYRDLQGSAILQ